MSLDTLAEITGIPIIGGRQKKLTSEDRLVEVQRELRDRLEKDTLNYWPKIKIMFSIDVNATVSSEAIGKRLTKFNHENYMEIIQACVKKVNSNYDDVSIGAYSISEMNGCYVSNEGSAFIERSFTMEILGLPDLIGKELALNIKKTFLQESVLFIVGNHNRLL